MSAVEVPTAAPTVTISEARIETPTEPPRFLVFDCGEKLLMEISYLPPSPAANATTLPISARWPTCRPSSSVRMCAAREDSGTSDIVEYVFGPSIRDLTKSATMACEAVVGCTPSANRYDDAAPVATRLPGPQASKPAGGVALQAIPVVLVKPNAAAFALTSANSANVSTGITFLPASPANSVAL